MTVRHYGHVANSRADAFLKILLASTSVLAAASIASPANAQAASSQADQSAAKTENKSIVVTGYRQSIKKSLQQKRDANAVVEVITAEDISKFPDKNVADALQRVPGVIISRDGGEGKYVSVRGLSPDLTLTLLNGNYVASSETNDEATRSFNYVLMPSNMLSSAELFKTPEARIDEGGIGGTVILHTRRPLDLPAWTGFVTAEGTYTDLTKKVDPQLSGMVSWKNPSGTLGLLVGATYQKRTTRSVGIETEDWHWYTDKDANGNPINPVVDVNGQRLDSSVGNWWGQVGGFNDQFGHHYSGFFAPTSVDFDSRTEQRKRLGIQATAQWKPADNLTLTANYFRFDLHGDYILNQDKITEWGYSRFPWDGQEYQAGRFFAGPTFDPSHTIFTGAAFEVVPGKTYFNWTTNDDGTPHVPGTCPPGQGQDTCSLDTPQIRSTYSREKALSQTAEFAADWHTDTWLASAKVGQTWSKGGPSLNFYVSAKPIRSDPLAPRGWDEANQLSQWNFNPIPTMTVSPDILQKLQSGIALIDVGSTGSSWIQTKIKQKYAQLDVTKLFPDSFIRSIQFGVKYRDGTVHRNTGNTYWYCPGTTQRYQDSGGCGSSFPDPRSPYSGFFLPNSIDNFQGGIAANVFPAIDVRNYLSYLDKTYGSPVQHEEPNFIYNVGEKIWSGYLQANFKTDRFRGNLGVHVVRTQQHGDTTDRITKFVDFYLHNPDGSKTICPASGKYAAGVDVGLFPYQAGTCSPGDLISAWNPSDGLVQETFVVSALNKTYTDFLPAANFAFDVTPDVVLRGAASKVIARTPFTQLGALGNLSYYSPLYASDRAAFGANQGYYGSGGNKDLKPYEAWQADLGVEWYFHPGSVFGVGLFRKNIKNFTVPVVRDVQEIVGGQSVTIHSFSTVANGRNGISEGVEIYGQHTFDFGLGFQGNYTYNKTNLASVVLNGQEIGKSPLVGSAKWQANATVFYETRKFLARASMNWRGSVVGGLYNSDTMNLYTSPYHQLDLNAAYNFTDKLTLTASVLNATKSKQKVHWGNDTSARVFSTNYSGRIAYVGATYKF